MVSINPNTEIITDIAAKWDNTNVTGITSDIQIVNETTFNNSTVDRDAGVLILEDYSYNDVFKNSDHRTELYLVPAHLIISESATKTQFQETLRELDRCMNDYNDDNTRRYYKIVDFNNDDNNNLFRASFNIEVKVRLEALSV